ncbi:hypothetical protein L484_016339 [Morus notabilis]|uniref:Sieve element occlusion C-terminal domain-containing protein n=1 Tax=Morus notabilis TaxID=981085 RepID=W9QZJ1_9ROSA|nr:hypothetical protein L484_016339 [Morus notabilis]
MCHNGIGDATINTIDLTALLPENSAAMMALFGKTAPLPEVSAAMVVQFGKVTAKLSKDEITMWTSRSDIEEKYIFFYGGKENEWVQKFTSRVSALGNDPSIKDARIAIELFCAGKSPKGGEDLGILGRIIHRELVHHQGSKTNRSGQIRDPKASLLQEREQIGRAAKGRALSWLMGRSAGFSLGATYSSHRPQQQQQHAPLVISSGVSFTPGNNQDLLHVHGSDMFPSSHSSYHSQSLSFLPTKNRDATRCCSRICSPVFRHAITECPVRPSIATATMPPNESLSVLP